MLFSVSPGLIVTCFPVPAPAEVVGVAGEDEDPAGGDGEADTEVSRVVGRGDGVEASMKEVESVVGGRAAEAVAEVVLLDAQRRWMCG